jgi:hypothetical protein
MLGETISLCPKPKKNLRLRMTALLTFDLIKIEEDGGETGHHVVSISNKFHDGLTSRPQKLLFFLGHLLSVR